MFDGYQLSRYKWYKGGSEEGGGAHSGLKKTVSKCPVAEGSMGGWKVGIYMKQNDNNNNYAWWVWTKSGLYRTFQEIW